MKKHTSIRTPQDALEHLQNELPEENRLFNNPALPTLVRIQYPKFGEEEGKVVPFCWAFPLDECEIIIFEEMSGKIYGELNTLPMTAMRNGDGIESFSVKLLAREDGSLERITKQPIFTKELAQVAIRKYLKENGQYEGYEKYWGKKITCIKASALFGVPGWLLLTSRPNSLFVKFADGKVEAISTLVAKKETYLLILPNQKDFKVFDKDIFFDGKGFCKKKHEQIL